MRSRVSVVESNCLLAVTFIVFMLAAGVPSADADTSATRTLGFGAGPIYLNPKNGGSNLGLNLTAQARNEAFADNAEGPWQLDASLNLVNNLGSGGQDFWAAELNLGYGVADKNQLWPGLIFGLSQISLNGNRSTGYPIGPSINYDLPITERVWLTARFAYIYYAGLDLVGWNREGTIVFSIHIPD